MAKRKYQLRSWRHMRQRYGITPAEFLDMYENQGGKCAISGKAIAIAKDGSRVGEAVVDHCHETNQVRGLLCHSMNVALGHFKDDPELLRKAADYLEQHQELHKQNEEKTNA